MAIQGRIELKEIEELTNWSWAFIIIAFMGGLVPLSSLWLGFNLDSDISLLGGLITMGSCIAFIVSVKSVNYPIYHPQPIRMANNPNETSTLNSEDNVADATHTANNSLEEPQKNDKSEVKTLEESAINAEKPLLKSKKPSREELEALKEALGHQKGSFQYKEYGDGVYIVKYNPDTKKNDWIYLGKWSKLQKLINEES